MLALKEYCNVANLSLYRAITSYIEIIARVVNSKFRQTFRVLEM